MSSKYGLVFTLPTNLYAQGAPVIIAAGRLLRDNETGSIIAQLKLKNISDQVVIAAKVSLTLQNIAGKLLEKTTEHYYMDFHAERGGDFGQEVAVAIPDNTCRSCQAAVIEVVFTDHTVWHEETISWEPLSQPVPFSVTDPELLKQYRLTFGPNSSFYFHREKDLWCCACGTWNRLGQECWYCHNAAERLQEVSLQALQTAKERRLAEEHKQAEETEKKSQEEARIREIQYAQKRQKRKKIALFITGGLSILCIAAAVFVLFVRPMLRYHAAEQLEKSGEYVKAAEAFAELGDYKDAPERSQGAYYQEGAQLQKNGDWAWAAIAFGKLGDYQDARDRSLLLWDEVTPKESISGGANHTVGVREDGIVVAVGSNGEGQCNVGNWRDIVSVSAGGYHTVGLQKYGTVVATGKNSAGQCDVSEWRDIVDISAGDSHTVGLQSDGTVVAAGDNMYGQCDVSDWEDIIAVEAGLFYTIGLRADGTVVAAGENSNGQCDVSEWRGITSVSAGGGHTIGLQRGGTVVCAGSNLVGQCDVWTWEDIVAVSAGASHTIGLRADGTVVSAGSNDVEQREVWSWKEIVAVSAGYFHSLGVRWDGTVVVSGNGMEECNISRWTDIRVPQ